VEQLGSLFGISGICNILGAIKTAKYYNMGEDDVIVAVATDAMDRYPSVMRDMAATYGSLDEAETVGRVEGIFKGMRTDWIMPGTPDARERWHNLKYYTWVEQQGKTVEELDAQRDPAWWVGHQQMVGEIDSRLLALRQKEMPRS
jgi:cysteine synthase A